MSTLDTPGSLSRAIDEYLAFRKSQGFAKGTLKNDTIALRRLLRVTGNILFKNIHDGHITRYYEVASQSRSLESLTNDDKVLRGFFEWGRQTRRIPVNNNPMAGRRRLQRVTQKERRRLHVSKFPMLLDAAEHPRDRMVIALGLYLLLRQSEMTTLRIKDIDLDAGTAFVIVHKTKMQDLMPISLELDRELRRWLTFYASRCGRLEPDWYLVPARSTARYERDLKTGRFLPVKVKEESLKPTKPITHVERIAHRALVKIGFLTSGEYHANGMPKGEGEGIHTLRRSGGRAMFDALQAMEEAPSYPIRIVQAMLHHKTQAETERYIGLEPDRMERDKLIKGKLMYPVVNVVDLLTRREVSTVGSS